MNKNIFIIFIFFALSLPIYTQEGESLDETYYVNKCIFLLEKPVPEGFRRADRSFFRNDEYIYLFVENGIVALSQHGIAYNTTHEASAFAVPYYDYFEKNGWSFYLTKGKCDIYLKDDVYAGIYNERRSDGLITAMIAFCRNVNLF